MIRLLIILCFCLGFFSCKKEDPHTQPFSFQIDSIIIGYHWDVVNGGYKEEIQTYQLWKDIKYDEQGRLVSFGPEHFFYNSEGKVVETSMMTFPSLSLVSYSVVYDSNERVSDFLSSSNGAESHGFTGGKANLYPARSYIYEGNSSIPYSIKHTYLSDVRQTDPLLLDTISLIQDYYTSDGNNITKKISESKLKDTSFPENQLKVLNRWDVAYYYDNKPNVWRQLFRDIGFLSQSLEERIGIQKEWFYSKNNVVSIKQGDETTLISYHYDDHGRVIEIRKLPFSTIKFFYK